jgi:hypothetical protein
VWFVLCRGSEIRPPKSSCIPKRKGLLADDVDPFNSHIRTPMVFPNPRIPGKSSGKFLEGIRKL